MGCRIGLRQRGGWQDDPQYDIDHQCHAGEEGQGDGQYTHEYRVQVVAFGDAAAYSADESVGAAPHEARGSRFGRGALRIGLAGWTTLGFSEFTGAADDGHGPVDDLQTDHLYPGGEVFLENIGDAVFEVVQDLLFVVTVQADLYFGEIGLRAISEFFIQDEGHASDVDIECLFHNRSAMKSFCKYTILLEEISLAEGENCDVERQRAEWSGL